jgi:hypothetical protein
MPPADDRPFHQRFCEAVADAFDLPAFTQMIQFRLNVELEQVVWTRTAFATVVFEFARWCRRCGRVGELVAAAAAERAGRPDLQALRLEFDTLQPDQPTGVGELTRFATQFTAHLDGFRHLKAYKELHDVLHDLDGILPEVEREADARRDRATPIPEATARRLERLAYAAESWERRVDLADPNPWVGRFVSAVRAFLGTDPQLHPAAFSVIDNLPGRWLVVLNGKLVAAARRLELNDMVELLDRRLDGLPLLADAVTRFRIECVRFRDLITAHDLCQQVDYELRGAEGAGTCTPGTLLAWGDIRGWLASVRPLRPEDADAADTITAADRFQAGGRAEFDPLVEQFTHLFKAVDKDLLDATQPLLTAAFQLSAFLGNPR